MEQASRTTWLDQTFRISEDADVEVVQHPNGDLEVSYSIPECPTSRFTMLLPAAVARKRDEMVRRLAALVPISLVIIS